MSVPRIIDIDELSTSKIFEVATEYVNDWMSAVTLSKHTSVTPLAAVTWITYTRPINYISFTVHENPFQIYMDSKTKSNEIKSVDYTFPEKCVSENVRLFFKYFKDILNENFDFDTRMIGDVVYTDKSTKEQTRLRNFRSFFNYPEGSKSKSPSNCGGLRIDKRSVKDIYDLILVDNGAQNFPASLDDLSTFFLKFGTYKCTIKPCKIVSSNVHFGNEYKLTWQLLSCEKLTEALDDMQYLKILNTNKDLSNRDLDNGCQHTRGLYTSSKECDKNGNNDKENEYM